MITAAVAKATAPLLERIAALEAELAKAKKNSSNSSKPPSSDLVKPPKPPRKDGQRRQRGGQPGHEQHLRGDFPPEAIDQVVPYTLACCPDCGSKLRAFEHPADVLQQVEIAAAPTTVVEHSANAYWCPYCRKLHCASLPEAVKKAGLFGPRLTALVAYLKGVCHASFSTIRKFLRDVVRVNVSRGYLAKLIAKVSQSLAAAYRELCDRLPSEEWLNVDETGHRENRQRYWTWCFRAQLYTLFRIDKSRGSEVLVEALGTEFNGVLGCDYFSAYRKYMRKFGVRVQFCLAHLIRDVKFLLTLPGRERPGLRPAAARSAAGTVCRHPPPRDDDRGGFSAGVGGRTPAGTPGGHDRRAGHETCPQPGQTLPQTRRSVLPLRHHTGHRADQQPGRTGDSLCGDRPADYPGDAERERPPLVRAHLDRDGDLRPAGSRGLSVLVGFGPSSSLRHLAAFASAVRPLTTS